MCSALNFLNAKFTKKKVEGGIHKETCGCSIESYENVEFLLEIPCIDVFLNDK